MNYLAHAFLSGDDPDLLVGNFIADHVRGRQLETFAEGVRRGIMLHRQIDTFTDNHPSFRAAKREFYSDFNRYSGVLADIYFDHLLALNFDAYSRTSLEEFSLKVYRIYDESRSMLPETSGRFLQYVLKNNIYQSYANIQGIERVLLHLSHRIGHGVRLDQSLPVFINSQDQIATRFATLFSDLQREFGDLDPNG